MPDKIDISSIERLHMDNLSDFHCHCDYSIDAVGTIEEYCQAALRRGLAELCFTTHYDANPNATGEGNKIKVRGELIPTGLQPMAAYVGEVHHMAEKYYPMGLAVKLGVEFGWYAGCEKEVEKLKSEFDFEYMLCGVHEIDNLCFCCQTEFEKCFAGKSASETVNKYVDQLIAASDCKLFNTIAHLDYIRKYGVQYYGDELDNALDDQMNRLFDVLAKNGTFLEINTSGARKEVGDYFPRIGLINKARRAGVDLRYLGSDAHNPIHVGYDFEMASSLIPSAIGGCESL